MSLARLVGGARVLGVDGGSQENEWMCVGEEGPSKPVSLCVLWPFSFCGGMSLLMRTPPP